MGKWLVGKLVYLNGGRKMSDKRFKLDFDIDKIKQRFFVKVGKKVQIIDQERNHRIRDLYKACEVLNEQQEEIEQLKQELDKIPKTIREVWK